MITPKLVVTNVHCVDDEDEVPTHVNFGRDTPLFKRIEVVDCHLHPRGLEFVEDIDACNTRRRHGLEAPVPEGLVQPFRRFDIAVLELAERVEHGPVDTPRTREELGDARGNFSANPIAPFTSDPVNPDTGEPDHNLWEGLTVRAVGWGNAGGRMRPARRQFRDVEIKEVGHLNVFQRNQWGTPLILTPDVARNGDSGGPLYVGPTDDPIGPHLLGVYCCNWTRPVQANRDGSVLVTQPEIQDWLQPMIAEPGNGPVDVPPVPEPTRPADADMEDPDGDGLVGANDNCTFVFNPIQRDGDRDGRGDKCDACGDEVDDPMLPDADGDEIPDDCDLCPGVHDPEQIDTDGDTVGDACDECPRSPNPAERNCNLDAEVFAGVDQVPDGCDPQPCPSVQRRPLAAPGGRTGRASSGRLRVQGAIDPSSSLTEEWDTGLRFCPCSAAARDTFPNRVECELPEDGGVIGGGEGCLVDHALYDTPGPSNPWRVPTALTPGDPRSSCRSTSPSPGLTTLECLVDHSDYRGDRDSVDFLWDLDNPDYGVGDFHTDGTHAVWLQGYGRTGASTYERLELWASPYAEDPADLDPRQLMDLGASGIPVEGTLVASGWATLTDVETGGMFLFRLEDGARWRIPPPPDHIFAQRPAYLLPDEIGLVVYDEHGRFRRTLFRLDLTTLGPPDATAP